jgi:hypothetical protein
MSGLSELQSAKLAKLHSYGTRYEVEVEHPNGARKLVAYTPRRTGTGLVSAVTAHGERIVSFLGIGDTASMSWKGKGRDAMGVDGGGVIRFSGRTQREAIIEGELPFIAAKV